MENKTIESNNKSDIGIKQELISEEPFIIKYDNRDDAERGFVVSLITLIVFILLGFIAICFDYGFVFFIAIMIISAYGIKVSKKGITSSDRKTAIAGIIMGVVVEIINCGILLLICILKTLNFIIY